VCVLRYDNETGKGDHRHCNGEESVCAFIPYEAVKVEFLLQAA